jgi:hypothetical protein
LTGVTTMREPNARAAYTDASGVLSGELCV